MILIKSGLLIVVTAVSIACSALRDTSDLPASQVAAHMEFLASDDLAGRYPGTEGDLAASRYIEQYFKVIGLESGRQEFSVVKSLKAGVHNTFSVNGIPAGTAQFSPFGFSTDTSLKAEVVFCGYGINVEADSFEWNDYRGLDVKGKWVMALRGVPDIKEGEDYLTLSSEDRDKAMLAMDNKASGLLLVSGIKHDASDNLIRVDRKMSEVGIPVFHITRILADEILKNVNKSIVQLEADIAGGKATVGFESGIIVDAVADIDEVRANTYNIYGILAGSDPLYSNEYIVIGAHYDHLGFGGVGSSSRSQGASGIHNGADDNASGVAVMMELASRLKENQPHLKRSYLFVAFGAEEMGLLGSKHFVNHLPVELSSVNAMINLDMVGRLDTLRGIQIGGTGSSVEADSLIRISNKGNFKLRLSREGSGPSDHSSFYGKNIPVFFITSGAHSDYHTPEDDAERINVAGMNAIADFAGNLLTSIDNYDRRLTFAEAGPREAASGQNARFKVTLGFMPDFSSTDIEGVRVDQVTKGKAADRGGIKNGDIIKAIDGLPVKNIYDYMYRLGKLSKNQIISVEILREDKKEVLLIQL